MFVLFFFCLVLDKTSYWRCTVDAERRQVKWLWLHTSKANSFCLAGFNMYFNWAFSDVAASSLTPVCQVKLDTRLLCRDKGGCSPTVLLGKLQGAATHFRKEVCTWLTFSSLALCLRGLGIWVWLSGSFFCVTLSLRFVLCFQNGDRHHPHLAWMYKDALKSPISSGGREKAFGVHSLFIQIFFYRMPLNFRFSYRMSVGRRRCLWIFPNYMQTVWGKGFHHHLKEIQILKRAENHSSRQFLYLSTYFVCLFWPYCEAC